MIDPEPDEAHNPFAPPGAPLGPEPPIPEEAPIGAEDRLHDRLVRALGPAHFASAVVVALSLASDAYLSWKLREDFGAFPRGLRIPLMAAGFVIYPALLAFHIALARGFLRRDPGARRGQIGLSSAVLASLVLGRLFTPDSFSNLEASFVLASGVAHVGILYLLTGTKGAGIVSPGNREAMAAAPDLGPSLVAGAILGGVAAGYGDRTLAHCIVRHIAVRLVGGGPD